MWKWSKRVLFVLLGLVVILAGVGGLWWQDLDLESQPPADPGSTAAQLEFLRSPPPARGKVLAEDPSSLLNVLLHGAETPVTQGNIGYHMPGYGWTLNDQQIAELVNTLRASWGNEGTAVKAAAVKAQRELHGKE